MTEQPTPSTPKPADDSQGSLGAVLIGGAILVVAGLLIFWPDGDAATQTAGGAAGGRGSAAQASSAGGGAAGSGQARGGIDPRDHDRAEGRTSARINPAIGSPTRAMAPPSAPKPEPTSFPSADAEIAYYEKKLEEARGELTARTTFLERMKRAKDNAKTPADVARSESRSVIVQQNYDKAKQKVDDLERKVASLREKKDGAAG